MAVRGAVAGGAAHGRRYIRSASARNSLRLELQIVIIRFADQQNTLQSAISLRRGGQNMPKASQSLQVIGAHQNWKDALARPNMTRLDPQRRFKT